MSDILQEFDNAVKRSQSDAPSVAAAPDKYADAIRRAALVYEKFPNSAIGNRADELATTLASCVKNQAGPDVCDGTLKNLEDVIRRAISQV